MLSIHYHPLLPFLFYPSGLLLADQDDQTSDDLGVRWQCSEAPMVVAVLLHAIFLLLNPMIVNPTILPRLSLLPLCLLLSVRQGRVRHLAR